MTGTDTWSDTTSSAEIISNGKTIPKGLSATTRYRLKVVATAGTKSEEFYIKISLRNFRYTSLEIWFKINEIHKENVQIYGKSEHIYKHLKIKNINL